ncbi:MAG: hypothetical protein IT557_18740 [Alphaproteobacteria bacterium]|nr:hypothetical protein [Alphaproteobacteria bacterium]
MTENTQGRPFATPGAATEPGGTPPSTEELLARAWAARAAAMPLSPRPPRGARIGQAGGAPLWAALAAVWLTGSPDPGMARRAGPVPSAPSGFATAPSPSPTLPASPVVAPAAAQLARLPAGMKDAPEQEQGGKPVMP